MSDRWQGLKRAFRLPLRGRAVKDEVTAELRFHFEERVEELVAAGLGRDAAEREVRARFGDLPKIGAEVERIDRRMVRRRSAAESLEALARDARFALRALRKSPGFTAVAILTLGLGIGANTAIFSAVNGVLLRPFDVPGLDRLFVIQQNAPGLKLMGGQLSPPMIEDIAAHGELFESFAGVSGSSFNLTAPEAGEATRIAGAQTMGRFFEVFAVRAALGRLYRPEDSENGNDHLAVLTWPFWRSWAGGDSAVIGRPIELNGSRYEVIGVLPASFTYRRATQLYVPMSITPEVRRRRGTWSTTAIGRVRPGLSPEQVAAGVARITAEWQSAPEKAAPPEMRWFLSSTSLVAVQAGELAPILRLLMAAVGLVLLIACANVANLQLVRAAAREKELAVRAAMGAGRWPIMRQLLVENALIALLGGGLGLGLGGLGLRALDRMNPASLPALHGLTPGVPVLLFALGITALSVLVFGLAPTLRTARADLHGVLRESGRGSSGGPGRGRLLGLSVTVQVAVSLMLLLGAGLLIRSLARLLATDPGFRPAGVVTFRVSLPQGAFGKEAPKAAFFAQLLDRLSAIPGVESAGAISDLPFGEGRNSSPFTIEGMPVAPGQPERHADMRFVQGDYFRAMGIPITRGRALGPADRDGSPWVAVVDASLARQYFGAENPIGHVVNQGPSATVVGVVGAVKHGDLSEPDKPTIYYAYAQAAWYSGLYLTLRTSLAPDAVIAQAKAVVARIDPRIPVYDIRAMQDRLDQSLGARRLAMVVLSGFAALALLLALLGVYGVLSYSTSRRTHELGIRMALGAVPGDVIRMVLGNGLALAAAGIAAGLAGFLAMARLLSALLYGVTPHDPATIAAGVLLLALSAVVAAYLPARRAARVDPVRALREE
jgi:predicted permease